MGALVRDKFGIFRPPPPQAPASPTDVAGLTGRFIHRFDLGHRLYLPTAFRSLGPTLVLSSHPAGCLRIDAPVVFARFLQPLAQRSATDPLARTRFHHLAGSATSVSVDSRGRFTVPDPLRTQAGMHQRVVFVGCDDHLEAWALERWEQSPREQSADP